MTIRSDITESFNTSSLSDVQRSKVPSLTYLLNIIRNMEKKSVVPLNAYKEILRFLINHFNDVPYLNEELETVLVKCRYGNPERTIANFKDHDNIILPLITISQASIVEADERRRVSSMILQGKQWDDKKQRAERVVSLCDRPVNIQYSVNVWSKYMNDMDQVAQQIRLMFNPSIELFTKFSRDSNAYLTSETNNYSFSVGDREDRIIKKSFLVTVETYLRSPRYKITSTGKIEEVNIDGSIL